LETPEKSGVFVVWQASREETEQLSTPRKKGQEKSDIHTDAIAAIRISDCQGLALLSE
jgi:hypothetical protein